MYNENEKEWILEAINHLKRRKARPDFSRISLRMKRKHQFTFIQTRRLLDSLVESGFVVKAVYKNNTSYRDVSKWKKGRLGGQILNSGKMLRRFVNAIRINEFQNKGTGVTVKQIEHWFSGENEDKCFLSGAALRDAIENEVSNGYLSKIVVDNEAFYTVNHEKLKELEGLIEDSATVADKKSDNVDLDLPHSDSDQDEGNESQSKVVENNVSYIMMAICETECEEGKGSSIVQIENWIIGNECHTSFPNISETLLLEIIEGEVKKGLLKTLVHKDAILYAVNEQALDGDDLSDHSKLLNHSENHKGEISLSSQPQLPKLSHAKSSKKKEDMKEPTDEEAQKHQTSKLAKNSAAPPVSLRPPSKRKRIMKDHGPDFEMELPTKSKKTVLEAKESTYPTPVDSPVSEKSEATIEQSFKFDFKKKRGRPKKKTGQVSETVETVDTIDESSHQGIPVDQKNESLGSSEIYGGPSEHSSICQDDENSNEIPDDPLINVHSWTAQQVADYFTDKGFKESAEQMLEHEMDGPALCLLKRSDIVGPPAGGMLKITKLGVALKLFRDIRNLLYFGNADNYADPYEEKAFMRS